MDRVPHLLNPGKRSTVSKPNGTVGPKLWAKRRERGGNRSDPLCLRQAAEGGGYQTPTSTCGPLTEKHAHNRGPKGLREAE